MKYLKSFFTTLFVFILIGPPLGGLILWGQGGNNLSIAFGLIYLFGFVPAALAGTINWAILLGFHVLKNEHYYWPCVLGTSLCMIVLMVSLSGYLPDWKGTRIMGLMATFLLVLPVWGCAHAVNGKAWDTLDT